MEENASAKANSDDEENLSAVSSEDEGNFQNRPPESPGDKQDNDHLEENVKQTTDDAKTEEKAAAAAAVAGERNKKQNRWRKGKKYKNKKEQETGEGAKNESLEKFNHGDKKKEDAKKPGQQSKKKDLGLVLDKGGTYSLWVRKPYPGYTHEEAYRQFVFFGSVAEINFLEQNFFVKYYAKESAMAALKRLKGVLNVEPAHVKSPGKNMHGSNHSQIHSTTVFKDSTPRPTEVYIGNISLSSNKKELEKLIEDTKLTSLRYHNKNGKGFAFVLYPNLNSAKKAVSIINGKVLKGRALMCRLAEHPSDSAEEAAGVSLLGNYSPSQPSQDAIAVLVKNMHPDTKENHLYTLFSRYGGATYVQIKFVASKNCVEAIVGLHSDWFAQAAIKELQGQIVDGRMLTISYEFSGAGHHGSAHHGSHNHHGNMKMSTRPFHGQMNSHPHPAVSKLQQATDLAHRVDALVDEVLDDCHYCERIKMLMSELQYVLLEVAEEVGH